MSRWDLFFSAWNAVASLVFGILLLVGFMTESAYLMAFSGIWLVLLRLDEIKSDVTR